MTIMMDEYSFYHLKKFYGGGEGKTKYRAQLFSDSVIVLGVCVQFSC